MEVSYGDLRGCEWYSFVNNGAIYVLSDEIKNNILELGSPCKIEDISTKVSLIQINDNMVFSLNHTVDNKVYINVFETILVKKVIPYEGSFDDLLKKLIK